MTKKILTILILLVMTMSIVFSGCSTAQSRRRDHRIEELERRVAKIEIGYNDGLPPDDDFSRYREVARSAR
jgi:hypothetical protein